MARTITLTYDEVLDEENEPASTDFAVTVDGDSDCYFGART